jgi:uncharacterized cupin superfamily protein
MDGPVIQMGEVERRRVTVGPIDGWWTDLGSAAGTSRLGLRRAEIEPGARSTPAHTHAAEEELVLVQGGSGLSWQGGATYEIGADDVLVHLIEGPAHTLVAGPDGLQVLVFGERAVSESCYLPRAGVSWLGPTWVKAGDGGHPFAQEAAAGELAMPAAPSPRPASIVVRSKVHAATVDRGDTGLSHRDLGRAVGSERTGLREITVAPGRSSFPPHCHSSEEELYLILEGSGAYLLQDAAATRGWRPVEHAVTAGDIVSARAGTGLAHTFRAGADGLVVLAYGRRDPGDIRWYPRSQKLAFPGVRVIGRVEPLGYWEGEE